MIPEGTFSLLYVIEIGSQWLLYTNPVWNLKFPLEKHKHMRKIAIAKILNFWPLTCLWRNFGNIVRGTNYDNGLINDFYK